MPDFIPSTSWRSSPLIDLGPIIGGLPAALVGPTVTMRGTKELQAKLNQYTELFVYPGNTHGIPDDRNQYLNAVAEFTWFEKWIRVKPWFTGKELLATLEEPKSEK